MHTALAYNCICSNGYNLRSLLYMIILSLNPFLLLSLWPSSQWTKKKKKKAYVMLRDGQIQTSITECKLFHELQHKVYKMC